MAKRQFMSKDKMNIFKYQDGGGLARIEAGGKIAD